MTFTRIAKVPIFRWRVQVFYLCHVYFCVPSDTHFGQLSIAAAYGLEVRGSNTGGSEIFPTRLDRPWGPPSLLTMGTEYFPGVKRPGRGVDHPPPSSA